MSIEEVIEPFFLGDGSPLSETHCRKFHKALALRLFPVA